MSLALTYTRDIPDPPSSPSVDVPNMKVNTNSIDTIWTRDHFSFESSTAGLHNRVQLVEINTALPVGLAPVNSSTLFAKVTENPLEGNLYYYRIGAPDAIQLTGPLTPVANQNGYTFLPGGILMQWGLQGSSSATSVPVTFNVPFPNNIYNVSAIPVRADTSPGSDFSTVIVTASPSLGGFTIGNIGGHTMVGWFWTAIGN